MGPSFDRCCQPRLLKCGGPLDAGEEVPERAGKLLAGGDRFLALILGKPVEQVAADLRMLDISALVHAEETKGRFVGDPVAVDEALNLRRRHPGKLALIGF